jgi:hypothetical protein
MYAAALNTNVVAPASVTAAMASDAASKFGAAHAGLYYYAAAPISKDGHGNITKSTQTTVAAGEKVTLTIAPGVSNNATGFIIYRSNLNGSNADGNFREMARIAADGQNNVTYVDLNRDIPGTSMAFILNMVPGMAALTVRRLLPMMKFPLYPSSTAEILWAQLIFFALRVAKPTQHVILKNILPRTASWRPFN